MVLGDELFTGGVPLEVDILEKSKPYRRTFYEWIAATGELIFEGVVINATSPTATMLTVPENRVFFLVQALGKMRFDDSTVSLAQNANMRITGVRGSSTPIILDMATFDSQTQNMVVVYPIPMKLSSGQAIEVAMSSASSSTNVATRFTIWGYLVDKNVLDIRD